MSSLAVVRDKFLNPWDCGNYYGLAEKGVDLYFCGTGPDVDWAQIMSLYPLAKVIKYDNPWEVFDLGVDVIDVPDAHYEFTQYFVERHDRTIVVAFDNLPGKNTLNPNAMKALNGAWKHVARSIDAFHTLSYDGVNEDKVYVIYGAVDTEFFKPGEAKHREGALDAVLFVGRLTIEKGLLDLIWAMKGIEAELWVVGEGKREYFEPWTKGLNVTWFGNVSRNKLANLYREAKVFCVPSIPLLDWNVNLAWLEQFGQVFIESMASGLPIVSTISGAIMEITSGVSNLVSPRNFSWLHTEIKTLLNSKEAWRESSEAGRILVLSNYSQSVIADDIMAWYEL